MKKKNFLLSAFSFGIGYVLYMTFFYKRTGKEPHNRDEAISNYDKEMAIKKGKRILHNTSYAKHIG